MEFGSDIKELAIASRERNTRYEKQFADHQSDIEALRQTVLELTATVCRLEGELKSLGDRFDRLDTWQGTIGEKVSSLEKKLVIYITAMTVIVAAVEQGAIGAFVKILAGP